MSLELGGIHHLTAITADARANVAFYTQVLGMRLVKKTVNQDDTSAYHLFYGDGEATPGSDITFFEWPVPPAGRGTHSVIRTGFRVSADSLGWWHERLSAAGVVVDEVGLRDGRLSLGFEDPEGQRLMLVDDGGAYETHPWTDSPVPPDHQIRGLGPIVMSVPRLDRTEPVLTALMNMREVRTYPLPEAPENTVHVFEMGPGGPAAELHVAVQPGLPFAREGAGGVHHVAFRTPGYEELSAWTQRVSEARVRSSGEVERYYFRSLYFREPNGVLFEIATDIPGFTADEPLETLGQNLSLPPFLESRRAAIEAGLKPV
ncbi:putative ring-cleaving dioxygenase MhqA [Hartmannibacter diazotrophicus]|uniref:Putative ring-cleaving dioxygenase MhqA n=1 Tax=Hartmannibacter diazotrophicus TaxID=1482074 RepID=A0A2C9CZZ2_9HYPH|nr:ring-cleaving dioxygenase [Hartmannibacter diazotrophicus]SON53652.1 putative ring-cleaving dioxygenase MhqA [Hartmannibacter diazotrophicus]